MDQKMLYQRQAGDSSLIVPDYESALIGRDKFVIDYISSRFASHNIQANVIELSIGEGRLTQSLLHALAELKLTCVDISRNRIEHVQKTLEANTTENNINVTFVECNFDTEFNLVESSKYEYVVALDIMEHVLDVFNFIENCYRILKPGGLLFIRVPNIAYIKHRVGLLAGKLPVTASWFGPPDSFDAWREQHGWDGGHLHLFTIPTLMQLLNEAGFSVDNCRDPGTSYSFVRNVWPNLLYSNPLIVARKVEK
jgi:2-polyprenyl-3-methyl-5-hydroxy-6-metoxy-1,4-benzoquinol methylase